MSIEQLKLGGILAILRQYQKKRPCGAGFARRAGNDGMRHGLIAPVNIRTGQGAAQAIADFPKKLPVLDYVNAIVRDARLIAAGYSFSPFAPQG